MEKEKQCLIILKVFINRFKRTCKPADTYCLKKKNPIHKKVQIIKTTPTQKIRR